MILWGTGGHDRLDGSRDSDQILGAAGHDTLNGGGADDTLDGGTGNDVLSGGDGHDAMEGGAGHDRMDGGGGTDVLIGSTGNDTLNGGDGEDYLCAGFEGDRVMTNWGADQLDGGDGLDTAILFRGAATASIRFDLRDTSVTQYLDNGTGVVRVESVSLFSGRGADKLTGGVRSDTFFGGAGNDTLDGWQGDDLLIGEAGNDVIHGGNGDDRLAGGLGHDSLTGGTLNDTLSGDTGEDVLTGSAGDDVIDGGSGLDTAVYSGNKADYDIFRIDDGVVLRDLRPNGDGTDTLVLVDRLAFADGTVTMAHMLSRGRAPVAQRDVVTVSEDGVGKVNVLANDRDDDGDTLSVVSVTSANPNLSLAFTRTGQVTVTPGAAYQALGAGQSVVTAAEVVVRDPYGNTSHSTLSVTVTGANDAPTAVNDVFTLAEDGVLTGIDVTLNDHDPDANAHLFVFGLNLGSTLGTVTIHDDGTLSYDPGRAFQYLAAGETATDSFTYELSDGFGGHSTASITVNIVGADETVIALDQPFMAAYAAGWDMFVYG
ncbi:Ig-like domain-containing protein [Asticcacaulis sp. AC402]|uniref:Ig-like domain-containing protein n=1 Tax=Asticcacaulis sp. AC402 TaxID=1282361 RepID=UPI0003C40996|nr:Ig-like domain-containing protein [Asticcacaulis sp. AC402]ESQ77110.1 hypothetical protein ABAC402_01555 [Asticcacaulis sp. AC402]